MVENSQMLFHSLPISCVILKPAENDFQIENINEKFCSVFSSDREKLLGNTFSKLFSENSFIPKSEAEKWLHSLKEVLNTGKSAKIECSGNNLFKNKKAEGETSHFEIENIFIEENKHKYVLSIFHDVTPMFYKLNRIKHLEELLLEKSNKENHFIEQNNDGLFCLDLEGNFTNINQGIVQLAETPEEKLINMSFFPFCAPHHLQKITTFFNQAKQGETRKYEADFISATGTTKILEISLAPVRTKRKITGVYGIARDITILKKSQNALENNEKKFKALIQEGSDLMAILDLNATYKFVSDTSLTILGLSPDDLVGKCALDYIHPEDQEWVLETFSELHNLHQLEIKPYRFKDSQDQWRWVETKATNLSHDPYVGGVVVNSRDVTERINSQKILLESEERYRSLFENSPDAMLVTVPNGNILAANPSACEMFQLSEKEICKIGRAGVVDQSDPRLEEALELRRRTGVASLELNFLRKDGTRFPGEVTSAIFNNSDGKVLSTVMIRDISGKKIIEEKLRRSREKYKFLFDFNPLPIWIFDNDNLELIDVNEAAIRQYGFSRKEFLKKKMPDLHTCDEVAELQPLLNAKETGQAVVKVKNLLHKKKDDSLIRVELTAYRFLIDNRDCTLVVCQDITEREQILQKLLDRETKLETAQKIARLGYWDIDLLNDSLFWSKEVYKIWRRDLEGIARSLSSSVRTLPSEVIEDYENITENERRTNKDFDLKYRIIPPVGEDECIHQKNSTGSEEALLFFKEGFHREKIKTALDNAIMNHTSFEHETVLITANGQERWVRVLGDPQINEGKCVRIRGSIQDIDKIKRSEMEVIKAAEEKQVILDSIGDAFFALNHDWKVTYWNKKAEEIFHCPKEQILRKKLGDVFCIENTSFEKYYKKAFVENRNQNFEAYYEATKNWFEVNAYPSPNGLSIYLRDITERKNSNLKLLDLNQDLKKYTEELVTANDGLEQFSYIISHNLRAPVANIIGLANMLDEKTYSEELKTDVRSKLRDSVERLDLVIRDLNQILQIKHNISEIKRPVHLKELVSSIEESLIDIINQEKVTINTDFNAVREFNTIKTYLQSIFYNLIFNSIKFRRPGIQPVINIRSEREGNKIKFIFRDNGLGIDLNSKGDQLYKLYKRFHHHVEGKGMGLFMVKTQVEMLGGKISVNSVLNKGTTFAIEFNVDNINAVKNGDTAEICGHR